MADTDTSPKGRRVVGKICICVGAAVLVLWGWLYLELRPQLQEVSEFERKYSDSGSLLSTMGFPTEQKELDAIVYRAITDKCKEIHDCSQSTINSMKLQFDSMRFDFDWIERNAASRWDEAEVIFLGPIGRMILSPFCQVISGGYKPQQIGHVTAIVIALPLALLILFVGIMCLKPPGFLTQPLIVKKEHLTSLDLGPKE